MTGIARVALMLTVGGAIAGFTTSVFIPHRYMGSARFVFVSPYDVNGQALFESASDITLLPQSLELMIRRSPYFKNRLYIDSAADLVTETRSKLSIRNTPPTGGIIEFETEDAGAALELTSVTLNEFGNNAARVVNAKKASDVIRIVKLPDAHLTGITPWLLTATGLTVGALASLLVWILLPRKAKP